MQKSIAVILLGALSIPALGIVNLTPRPIASNANPSTSNTSTLLADCAKSCTSDRGSGRRNQQYNQAGTEIQTAPKRRGSGRVEPDASTKKRGSGRLVSDPKLSA